MRSQGPKRSHHAWAYFCLPATCFAAIAACFFCRALVALACFCDACLLIDLGDLSPIMFVFRLMACSPAA